MPAAHQDRARAPLTLTGPTLDVIAREGARRILTEALEAEVADYIERHQVRGESGRATVVRNGKARPRKVTLGSGTIEVRAPRVDDRRRDDSGERLRLSRRALGAPTHGQRFQSPFATVRLRQRVTKGAGSRQKGLLMAFQLLVMAERRWRRLNAAHLIPLVRAKVPFDDGI